MNDFNDSCNSVENNIIYSPLFENEYSVKKANKKAKKDFKKSAKTNKSSVSPKTTNTQSRQNLKLTPRTQTQGEYLSYLNDMSTHILFGVGPAGSGKTYMAAKWAALAFMQRAYDKIVIVRPAVTAGEKIGYLPGDLKEKMEPLLLPILDVFEETFGRQQMDSLINLNKIEFAPLGFLRGRTFTNSVVIFDESQNSTVEQMKLILSRIGEGSRIIITGDVGQTDIKKINGLQDFLTRYTMNIEGIKVIYFSSGDIVRHHLIDKILNLYDEYNHD